MPTLGRPVSEGGMGFDYRLAMGAPDLCAHTHAWQPSAGALLACAVDDLPPRSADAYGRRGRHRGLPGRDRGRQADSRYSCAAQAGAAYVCQQGCRGWAAVA